MKFAECMRANGVSEFPDPDASGKFDIDGVRTLVAASRGVQAGHRRVQGPAATGVHLSRRPDPRAAGGGPRVRPVHPRQRREGLPGPRQDGPLIDTNRIPSADTPEWYEHSQRGDGEVRRSRGRGSGGPVRRKTWAVAGAVVLAAAAATGGVVVASSGSKRPRPPQEPPANTAKVEQGELSAMVSLDGILTYRARSDGSPYSVINQAGGIYTELPEEGDKVDCGDVLLSGGRRPGAAAVWHGPGLPRPGHRRSGQRRPSAQPEPARSSATTPTPASISIPTTTSSPRRRRRRSRCSSTTRAST